jgi:hypothetical protein
VDALNLAPAMVTRARRRLGGYEDQVRVVQGSATDLRIALDPDGPGTGGESGGYDAVFEFAIVHHVRPASPGRPGCRFYFDEATAAALATRGYRWLFNHPWRTVSLGASSSPNSNARGCGSVAGAPTCASTT